MRLTCQRVTVTMNFQSRSRTREGFFKGFVCEFKNGYYRVSGLGCPFPGSTGLTAVAKKLQ